MQELSNENAGIKMQELRRHQLIRMTNIISTPEILATEMEYGLEFITEDRVLTKYEYMFVVWKMLIPEINLWYEHSKILNNRLYAWVRLADRLDYIIEINHKGIVNKRRVHGWIASDEHFLYTTSVDSVLLQLDEELKVLKNFRIKVGKLLSFRGKLVFIIKKQDLIVGELVEGKVCPIKSLRCICDWTADAFRCFDKQILTWHSFDDEYSEIREENLRLEVTTKVGRTLFPELNQNVFPVREVVFDK